jgi:uncharacterized protein YbjT (DUF2867 family)
MQRVLVIGGTGRTGRHIVQKLTHRGDSVRVLIHQAKNAQIFSGTPVEFTEGDITQLQDVEAAVRDIDGVVIVVESANSDDAPNSPEQVHYQGTRNVLSAVGSRSVQIVLVTQIYITRPERYPEVSNIIHWRQQAEESVRSSGLPYTIVRPGWLTNDADTQEIRLDQGDLSEGQVAREAVAEVCVQALHYPSAQGKTFEVYSKSGTSSDDWKAVFTALQYDSIQVS